MKQSSKLTTKRWWIFDMCAVSCSLQHCKREKEIEKVPSMCDIVSVFCHSHIHRSRTTALRTRNAHEYEIYCIPYLFAISLSLSFPLSLSLASCCYCDCIKLHINKLSIEVFVWTDFTLSLSFCHFYHKNTHAIHFIQLAIHNLIIFNVSPFVISCRNFTHTDISIWEMHFVR